MDERPLESPDVLATPAAGPAAIRGGALRVAGYGAGVLFGLVATALLFRHLGVVETGYYVTVLSLVAVVGGVSDAGLTAIGVRELSARDRSDRHEFVRNLLGLRVVLTGVGLVVAVGFAVAAGYPDVMIAGTVLSGLGLLLQSLQATLAISLMSALRLGWVTAAELLRSVASTLLIVLGVLVGSGLLTFLSVPIVASLLMLTFTAWLVRRDIPLVPAFQVHAWWALLREVLPYSVAVAAGVLYFRIAVLIVSLVASEEATGLFSASFRVVDVLVAIPALMMGAAFPIFARTAHDDHQRLAYGFGRTFEVSVILGAGVMLMVGFGAPAAIDVVAGPDFAGSVDVLRIQAVGVGASFVAAFWAFALLSLRMHREILFVNLLALALITLLVAVLAASSGAEGAAVGTAVAELATLVIYPLVLRRRHPELMPGLGSLPRVALALGVAATIALVSVPALAQLAIAVLVYTGLLIALRAVPAELMVEVRRLRRGPANPDSGAG